MIRVRIRHSKLGKVRFVGSRDSARIWERVLRIAKLPVVMSEGFTPRARMHFGLALGVAQESDAEYMDVDLHLEPHEADLDQILIDLNAGLPPGMVISDTVVVDRSEASLQAVVLGCTWHYRDVGVGATELAERAEAALAADEIVIERSRKGRMVEDDVRPTIERLWVDAQDPSGPVLGTDVVTKPRSLRPLELLKALGIDAPAARIRRIEQWTGPVDARSTPLEVPSARTAVQLAQAAELRVPPPLDGGLRRDTPNERLNAERGELEHDQLPERADA